VPQLFGLLEFGADASIQTFLWRAVASPHQPAVVVRRGVFLPSALLLHRLFGVGNSSPLGHLSQSKGSLSLSDSPVNITYIVNELEHRCLIRTSARPTTRTDEARKWIWRTKRDGSGSVGPFLECYFRQRHQWQTLHRTRS